jgi:putative neutral zinc metallopeptidase
VVRFDAQSVTRIPPRDHLLLAVLFGPQWWVRHVLARHGTERADMPAAQSVLRAAAWTYVAAALATLLDVARWLRVLRF